MPTGTTRAARTAVTAVALGVAATAAWSAHASPAIITATNATTTGPAIAPATTTTLPSFVTTTTSTTEPVIATAPPTTTTTTTEPAIAPATVPTTTTTTTTEPALAPATTTTTTIPGADPDTPIGEIDTTGVVPDGLDLAAVPIDLPAPGPVAGDDPAFAAGLTCAYQCIKSGRAYPRGFGAQLVVETHVPARLWMSTIADTTGDGNYDFVTTTHTTTLATSFSWAVDHLAPGQLYYVTVQATDANDDYATAYGTFTTLSNRTVVVSVGGGLAFVGGPSNVSGTFAKFAADDAAYQNVPTLAPIPFIYTDAGRHIDLRMFVMRTWSCSVVEGYDPNTLPPQGESQSLCGAWNTARLDGLDVDVIPTDQSSWGQVNFQRTLQTPSGNGLPLCYGQPNCFTFTAPVTVIVAYT